ncbi:MAG TPA: cbb3-type cytochrome oxidase assembly protein CcoS [Moheibacter sp.]|nr:cbb3-type cytochrome oxidase assembly protein CcoS [Moheibacter sp.]
MGILILMVLASVSLAAAFLVLFLVGIRKGQFDEGESPAVRMLKNDKKVKDKID